MDIYVPVVVVRVQLPSNAPSVAIAAIRTRRGPEAVLRAPNHVCSSVHSSAKGF